MKILEDLWYGNIDPHERSIKKGSQIERTLALFVKNDNAMQETLTEQQKVIFKKFKDCQSELTDLLEREAFAEGFCLAVKIMIDVINTMEILSVDD